MGNQAYDLLAEIPSDTDSITSDAASEDEIDEFTELVDLEIKENEMETSPIFEVENVLSDSDWSSEDELPLSSFVARDNTIIWTNNSNYYIPPGTFTEETGPNIPDSVDSPIDVFLCLFPESLLKKFVFETNLYATQNGKPYKPTTLEEIKVFFGVNLLMGFTKKSSYKDYWSSKLELRDQFISSCLSRDRFAWLLQNIHLNDNMLQPQRRAPEFDKLHKIRPLLDTLSETFSNCYNPTENQSIDESMIKFKGRSSLRQYMPMKPIKRGYKVWERASETGFVSQFQIYTGKVDAVEQNLGPRVVKDLTRSLIRKNHRIYFDNFFNTCQLQQDLLYDGIYACGTARKGRKDIPKDFIPDKSMKRGDTDWRISTKGLIAAKWLDRKPVLFLSNFHDPNDMNTVSRKRRDGTREDVTSLQLVKDYNNNMGYVDKSDMYISLYKINRKSKKWWHRILWHFLELSIVNAYIIFKCRAGTIKNYTLKEFRLAVANGLVGANNNVSSSGRKSNEPLPHRFKPNIPLERRLDKCAHLPVHGTKTRCVRCSTAAKPHRTRWHCKTCNVGLCLTKNSNCFLAFHSK